MEKSVTDAFVHRENLALFRRRIAETKDDMAREILMKLLAEEEAKGTPSKEK
jgi:hypothetical protein